MNTAFFGLFDPIPDLSARVVYAFISHLPSPAPLMPLT